MKSGFGDYNYVKRVFYGVCQFIDMFTEGGSVLICTIEQLEGGGLCPKNLAEV